MTRDRLCLWLSIIGWFCTALIAVSLAFGLHDAAQQRDDFQSQLKGKDDQIYERQLKYEEEKSIKERLGQELADAQDRLSKATERDAKVRASRSRASRPASRVPAREANVGVPSFQGGLRDITMYCPTGSHTASGKWPTRGMVATISRSIPFGTRIRIEGLGEYVVEDRIGHGSEFDIFTPSCSEADAFGRKQRRVTILDVD